MFQLEFQNMIARLSQVVFFYNFKEIFIYSLSVLSKVRIRIPLVAFHLTPTVDPVSCVSYVETQGAYKIKYPAPYKL